MPNTEMIVSMEKYVAGSDDLAALLWAQERMHGSEMAGIEGWFTTALNQGKGKPTVVEVDRSIRYPDEDSSRSESGAPERLRCEARFYEDGRRALVGVSPDVSGSPSVWAVVERDDAETAERADRVRQASRGATITYTVWSVIAFGCGHETPLRVLAKA